MRPCKRPRPPRNLRANNLPGEIYASILHRGRAGNNIHPQSKTRGHDDARYESGGCDCRSDSEFGILCCECRWANGAKAGERRREIHADESGAHARRG